MRVQWLTFGFQQGGWFLLKRDANLVGAGGRFEARFEVFINIGKTDTVLGSFDLKRFLRLPIDQQFKFVFAIESFDNFVSVAGEPNFDFVLT